MHTTTTTTKIYLTPVVFRWCFTCKAIARLHFSFSPSWVVVSYLADYYRVLETTRHYKRVTLVVDGHM